MPKAELIAALHPEITAIRRDLHRHPELMYDVHRTAGIVAQKLTEWGVDEVVAGLGKTGVVGVIKGRNQGSGKVVAMRADMDALPIHEETNLEHRSTVPGKMHACGHDGHTAMLLGAAKYLAETRDFDGTAIVIFQPAEEGGAGAKAMIEDGLLERFAIDEVYALHNMPGIPLGHFAICAGPIMAATDEFNLTVRGRGAHAAIPQQSLDPILAGATLVQALQQVVSRNVDPLASLVLSVTKFQAGFAHNVIPDTALVAGTVRSLTPEMRDLAEARIAAICGGVGETHGVEISCEYIRNYPVTVNDAGAAEFCAAVAAEIVPAAQVDTKVAPLMGGEDFSYMLEKRPGAFIFVGNGDSAGLHNAKYNFNDDVIPYGVSYWLRLAERALAGA